MISEPQRPGASEVCFAIGEKSAGQITTNYFQMKINVLK